MVYVSRLRFNLVSTSAMREDVAVGNLGRCMEDSMGESSHCTCETFEVATGLRRGDVESLYWVGDWGVTYDLYSSWGCESILRDGLLDGMLRFSSSRDSLRYEGGPSG
jgi:hypothetical protein